MSAKVLVTGGAGYIGSHTVVQLLNAGVSVIIFDSLCNSKRIVIDRIEAITGRRPDFAEGDIRDREALQQVFKDHSISGVIHF
ncbi:MAG: SDR family NAD(P)-dependent oxidoreductase, partial [Gammaproteobacteria bacterium]